MRRFFSVVLVPVMLVGLGMALVSGCDMPKSSKSKPTTQKTP